MVVKYLQVFAALFLLSSGSPTNAQVEDESGRIVYPTDAYGNVQPIETEWRSVGSFRNPIEREALTGYQTSTRRYGQRSGSEPFALPSDVWSVSQLSAIGTQDQPKVRSGLSQAKRRAFEKYGGFASRRQTDPEGGTEDVLGRKVGLLNAYSINAPVYRALSKPKSMVDLQSRVTRTPFLYSEASLEEAPTLEAQLERVGDLEYDRIRTEAWALFRDGDYRRAIRTFETAITLSPNDLEARIGEIFAYMAVGARRTAAALFTELLRRDENPFRHDLRMRERFGNVADPNTMQILAGMASRDESQSVEANALFTFVLWYLGQQDEAMRSAEALARRAANRPYATWPAKMSAVRAAPPAAGP